MKKSIFIVISIAVIIAISASVLFIIQKNKDKPAVNEMRDIQIECTKLDVAGLFGGYAGGGGIYDKLIFDEDVLQSKIDKSVKENPVYVFGEPEENGYDLPEKFGFDKDDYTEVSKKGEVVRRVYKNDFYRLTVDKYGYFNFSKIVKDGEGDLPEMEYSVHECSDIAKKFLQEKNLWRDDFSGKCSIDQMSGGELKDGKWVDKVTGYGIGFGVILQGRKVFGRTGTMVDVNSLGEVYAVTNTSRTYTGKMKVDLITVKEAADKVRSSPLEVAVLIGEENINDEIHIKNVEIAYYENGSDSTITTVQPIYIFYDGDSTKESSAVVFVQANRIK